MRSSVFNLEELARAINENRLREYTIRVLRELGVKPSRRLGQNFTVSIRLVNELRYHLEIFRCDKALEIGTGLGVITFSIRDLCKEIITVEKDPRLCRYSMEILSSFKNIRVICGDALRVMNEIDFDCAVGTPPYSITGPMLGRIAASKALLGVLVLQRDVVDRILSKPNSKRYGSISALIQTYFKVERGGVYSVKAFYPEPEVASELIIMRRYRERLQHHDVYERFLKCLFSQRRRRLRNALETCSRVIELRLDRVSEELLSRRVYTLSPEELLSLFILTTTYN